jgi:hypothetical protein
MNIRELGKLRARRITGILTIAGILGATATGLAVWTGETTAPTSTSTTTSDSATSTNTGSTGSVQSDTGTSSVAQSGGS